jgi:hypothetical protein
LFWGWLLLVQNAFLLKLLDYYRLSFGFQFRGTEKYLVSNFVKLNPDVKINGKVGFMGPSTANADPSYEDVCTGRTGHVEVYDFEFTGGSEVDMIDVVLKRLFKAHVPPIPLTPPLEEPAL